MQKREYLSDTAIFNSGSWFMFHQAIAVKLGILEAVLLQYLMNYHERVISYPTYRWDDGWFYCKSEKILQELGMNASTQTRCLHKLAGKSPDGKETIGPAILTFERRKIPSKRYIRINGKAVKNIHEEWLDDKIQQSEKMESEEEGVKDKSTVYERVVFHEGKTCRPSKKGVTKKKVTTKKEPNNKLPRKRAGSNQRDRNHGIKPKTSGLGIKVEHPENKITDVFLNMLKKIDSDLLYVKKDKDGKTVRSAVSKTSLRKSIVALHLERKEPYPDIEKVMVWLEKNCKEPWVPVIYKVLDFKDNFGRIRDAMNRERDTGATTTDPELATWEEQHLLVEKAERAYWRKYEDEYIKKSNHSRYKDQTFWKECREKVGLPPE